MMVRRFCFARVKDFSPCTGVKFALHGRKYCTGVKYYAPTAA